MDVTNDPVRGANVVPMSHLGGFAPRPVPIGPRISVLGAAAVESGFGTATVTGRDAHPLLALLAMTYPRPVTVRDVIREIETETGQTLTAGTFRTRISRLNKALARSGMAVEKAEVEGAYRLSAEPSWVDAVEFERLGSAAEASRKAEHAREALMLWSGDIPAGAAHAPLLARLADLRVRLEPIAQAKTKRVLVVEDVAGAMIKRRLRERYLGDITIVVESDAAKVLEYLAREDTEDFDLVLLDFHLTQGDEAFQGYEVGAAIRDGDALTPVLGMSYHRSDVHNDTVISLIYDFWDVMPKRSAAGAESLDAIVSRALRLLDAGTAQIHRHYRDRVHTLIECARDEIYSQGNDASRLTSMEAAAASLRAVAEKGTLDNLRIACREFAKRWLPHG